MLTLHFCPVVSSSIYLSSFPRPISAVASSSIQLFGHNRHGPKIGGYHTSTRGVTFLSANLECRSEICCMRLAGNTGRKNDAKNRHMGTIVQLCRAESSQLKHSRQSEKNDKKQNLLNMSS